MAKIGGVFVCLLILVLDIAAGLCGIEAEIAEHKAKHLRLWIFECKDPSHEAFLLGVAAAGLLALAHLIANLLGGCPCFWSQQKGSCSHQFTTTCLLFSWIALAVGFSMLVIGILANEKARASCGFTHHHMLSIGGILCFVHGMFTVTYYISATSGAN